MYIFEIKTIFKITPIEYRELMKTYRSALNSMVVCSRAVVDLVTVHSMELVQQEDQYEELLSHHHLIIINTTSYKELLSHHHLIINNTTSPVEVAQKLFHYAHIQLTQELFNYFIMHTFN